MKRKTIKVVGIVNGELVPTTHKTTPKNSSITDKYLGLQMLLTSILEKYTLDGFDHMKIHDPALANLIRKEVMYVGKSSKYLLDKARPMVGDFGNRNFNRMFDKMCKFIDEELAEKAALTPEQLGDGLCDHCPLEVKGAASIHNNCEGCRCSEAYEIYLESLEE